MKIRNAIIAAVVLAIVGPIIVTVGEPPPNPADHSAALERTRRMRDTLKNAIFDSNLYAGVCTGVDYD